MSDKIFDLIKTNVLGAIAGNSEIPSHKKQETVSVTTDALIGGMKDNFSLENIPALTNLFGGGASSPSALTGNPIVSSITNTVVNSLVEKVGLPKALSSTIATAVVPMVINAISSKVSGSEKGFDVESLIKSFSGGNNDSGGLGGMLGSLGKLFS